MSNQNWRELFRTYNVSEQLFPLLKEIGTTEGMYRAHIDEVTYDLIDSGYLLKPELRDISSRENRWNIVIEALLSLNNNQHLILPHSMFPEHDSFSRKEDLLLPLRYDNKNPVSVAKNLENKLRDIKLSDDYVGYDIQGVFHTDKYYRTTTLIDCIRGQIMHNAAGLTFVFKSYKGNAVKSQGANATIMNIPSIDSNNTYEIGLERIAVYDLKWGKSKKILNDIIKTSYNLEAKHTCTRITRKSGFSRKSKSGIRYGSEVDFDHHVIAAFKAVKKDFENQGFYVLNPFFEPGSDLFNLYKKFNRNILIEHQDSSHVQRVPMTLNEMEIVLWKVIGYNNSKN